MISSAFVRILNRWKSVKDTQNPPLASDKTVKITMMLRAVFSFMSTRFQWAKHARPISAMYVQRWNALNGWIPAAPSADRQEDIYPRSASQHQTMIKCERGLWKLAQNSRELWELVNEWHASPVYLVRVTIRKYTSMVSKTRRSRTWTWSITQETVSPSFLPSCLLFLLFASSHRSRMLKFLYNVARARHYNGSLLNCYWHNDRLYNPHIVSLVNFVCLTSVQ